MDMINTKNVIKVYSFDLDGTLLKNDKTIDKETIDYINSLSEHKYIYIFASGRKYSQIKPYVYLFSKEIQNRIYVISSGGEYIYSPDGEKIWSAGGIKNEKVELVCRSVVSSLSNLQCTIVTEFRDYVIRKHYGLIPFVKNIYHLIKGNKDSINIRIGNINKIESDIEKIIVHTIDAGKIQQCLKDFDDLNVLLIENKQVDIRLMTVNKSNAIMFLINSLGLKTENVIVFGDDENDLDVFITFPMSVAMSNATNEIKSMACFVTDSNEKNGVLKFLIKLHGGKA